MDIAQKTVLLTGAGSGIGRCLAGALAKQGAQLVLTDIHQASLDETIKTYGIASQVIATIEADLMDLDEAKRCADIALAKATKIDILFCNAGLICMGQVMNMPWSDFEKTLKVNQIAPIYLTHYLLDHFKENGSGAIAYTCSASALASPPSAAFYSMSKAAIMGFSESLRAEVSRYNIHVMTICPGFVHTPLAKNATYRDEASREQTTSVPKFVGTSPEKVAQLAIKGLQKEQAIITTGFDETIKRVIKFLSYRLYNKLNLLLAKTLLDKPT